MATEPRHDYSGDPTEAYGAGAAFVLFLFFFISYLSQPVIVAAMAVRLVGQLANTAPDFGDWLSREFFSAYVEPGAGVLRKILFTAPMPLVLACMIGGGLSWLFRKTGWLEFDDAWRFAIGFAATFAVLVMLLGKGDLVAYMVTQIRNAL
jgi:hypothetical protein